MDEKYLATFKNHLLELQGEIGLTISEFFKKQFDSTIQKIIIDNKIDENELKRRVNNNNYCQNVIYDTGIRCLH